MFFFFLIRETPIVEKQVEEVAEPKVVTEDEDVSLIVEVTEPAVVAVENGTKDDKVVVDEVEAPKENGAAVEKDTEEDKKETTNGDESTGKTFDI